FVFGWPVAIFFVAMANFCRVVVFGGICERITLLYRQLGNRARTAESLDHIGGCLLSPLMAIRPLRRCEANPLLYSCLAGNAMTAPIIDRLKHSAADARDRISPQTIVATKIGPLDGFQERLSASTHQDLERGTEKARGNFQDCAVVVPEQLVSGSLG